MYLEQFQVDTLACWIEATVLIVATGGDFYSNNDVIIPKNGKQIEIFQQKTFNHNLSKWLWYNAIAIQLMMSPKYSILKTLPNNTHVGSIQQERVDKLKGDLD